ncbi:hypothetical protein [Halochromatium roseum]|uniref:hypothetical protein n=1 Tax=Halochromatium roseum TaxID=391920 RepID=UPI001912B50F|nr:hypothetical protein [Halochromatium roseum]
MIAIYRLTPLRLESSGWKAGCADQIALRKRLKLSDRPFIALAQLIAKLGLLSARAAAQLAQASKKVLSHARLRIAIIPFREEIVLRIEHRHPKAARQNLIQVFRAAPRAILPTAIVVEIEFKGGLNRVDDKLLCLLIERGLGSRLEWYQQH